MLETFFFAASFTAIIIILQTLIGLAQYGRATIIELNKYIVYLEIFLMILAILSGIVCVIKIMLKKKTVL
jgi:hypothetical protein